MSAVYLIPKKPAICCVVLLILLITCSKSESSSSLRLYFIPNISLENTVQNCALVTISLGRNVGLTVLPSALSPMSHNLHESLV